ncbi:MAG TPA: tetratricopeptide repeat-containing glycosyltransferase family protein [Candidatus Angelobacter sp.]
MSLDASPASTQRLKLTSAGLSAGDYKNQAQTFLQMGRRVAAIACYQRALELQPDDVETLKSLGSLLRNRRSFRRALNCFRRVVELQPGDPSALVDLGGVLCACGHRDEAVACWRKSLGLEPSDPEIYCEIGFGFCNAGEPGEAADNFHVALRLKPNCASALFGLGIVSSSSLNIAQAIQHYEAALAIDPNHCDAHFALGLEQLLCGKLAEGWRNYEWRFRCLPLSECDRTQKFLQYPLWRGEPLQGAGILIHTEQGLGDTLQFARYVPLVAARGGRVVLEAPRPLKRLLSKLEGVDQLICQNELPGEIPWQCPLMSLPIAFNTELETIPTQLPQLNVDPGAVEAWSDGLPRDRLKVGLVWTGNPHHDSNRHRSVPLAALERLAEVDGISLFSLQKGAGREELRQAKSATAIRDIEAQCNDMADTATAIMALDLVITIDTSVAHLAGTLKKPVWILLACPADWRWLLQRKDSPWYPTARLFRQPAPGAWDPVIAEIIGELSKAVRRYRVEGSWF